LISKLSPGIHFQGSESTYKKKCSYILQAPNMKHKAQDYNQDNLTYDEALNSHLNIDRAGKMQRIQCKPKTK